jgi:hypothetical protein
MAENTQLSLIERQTKIDNILNKTALDFAVFSVIGWTIGIGAGIFFHKAAPIRSLLAGMGGSYGFVANRTNLKAYL